MTDNTEILHVRVSPSAKRPVVGGRWDDPSVGPRLVVKVAAPPEDGRANEAAERALATAFGVAARDVSIIRGHTGQLKTLRVTLNEAVFRARLAALLGHPDPQTDQDALNI